MSKDLNCPYCDADLEVCHDDGQGYEQEVNHQMQCDVCGNNFVFQTEIMYYYTPEKANCLNDGNHHWVAMDTYPKHCTEMECQMCGERRTPTAKEFSEILKKK